MVESIGEVQVSWGASSRQFAVCDVQITRGRVPTEPATQSMTIYGPTKSWVFDVIVGQTSCSDMVCDMTFTIDGPITATDLGWWAHVRYWYVRAYALAKQILREF